MNFTQGIPVEDFKKDFYGKTKDLTLYDCGDINIFKVVLDGLKVNYVSKGTFRTPLFLPNTLWNLWRSVQRKRRKIDKPTRNPDARVLLADLSGRSEARENNCPTSFYFQNLAENVARAEYIHVVENFKDAGYPHDIDLRKYHALQYLPLSDDEKKVRKDLVATFRKIDDSNKFDHSELANIKIAIQVFFTQFKIWNELLGQFPGVKHALLEQHYHHEGLLLALKKRNIRSIEIQHGLIAPSDIFYIFPKEVAPLRSRALFPDKILVYGEYWKDILEKGSEFAENDIIVMGDFRKKNDRPGSIEEEKIVETFVGTSKIILISGQTFISNFFASYIHKLSGLLLEKHPDWKVIMKPHPNEKIEEYAAITQLSNILVTKTNIHYLFKKASVHISVYSTTLYDSLEYGSFNFSLDHEKFRDYTRDILADKIAVPLYQDEDPVEKYMASSQKNDLVAASGVYSPFDREQFKKLFLN